jgi:hypothetical protein
VGLFKRKTAGYRAAWRVKTHRNQAEALRRDDPDLYQQILAEAEGEALIGAEEDPDAWVAIWLSFAAERAGYLESEAERDAHQNQVATLAEVVRNELIEMERDSGPRAYPKWALRQFVKLTILTAVLPPEDVLQIQAMYEDPSPEKPAFEEALDSALAIHGLSDVARDVIADVTISGEQWDAMNDDQRSEILERPQADVVD